MGEPSVLREFSRYVSFSVIGMICISIYVLADTYFIALALGPDGLTALNISIAAFSIVHGFGLMIGIGGATRFAIQKSRGENTDATFTHVLLTGAALAAIFVITGLFFTGRIAAAFGADDQILPLALPYMRTIFLFSPVMILVNILSAFIRNDQNPKLAMAGMVIISFANTVFDYIFLFPLNMGMFGAALATGLSYILCLFVLLTHFLSGKSRFKPVRCKLRREEVTGSIFLGSSALINELAFAVSLITFNLVILRIAGNVGVAAFGIVANIAILVISAYTGVAQGIQPLISKGHGSGNTKLVSLTLQYAIVLVVGIAVAIYAIAYLSTPAIIALFNSEGNVNLARLAEPGMRIYFVGLIFAGVNFVVAAFFSALGNARVAVAISVLRSSAVNIPMVIALGLSFGMSGVWHSFIATELIVCVISAIFLIRVKRQLKVEN
ncbi:MAG: MATE family efflux transporter [Oscillospiraceae bacterium]|nr:MATE family efflux transporter [Oscillospiraceae bacterium]